MVEEEVGSIYDTRLAVLSEVASVDDSSIARCRQRQLASSRFSGVCYQIVLTLRYHSYHGYHGYLILWGHRTGSIADTGVVLVLQC